LTRRPLALLAAAAALALVGCGGGDDDAAKPTTDSADRPATTDLGTSTPEIESTELGKPEVVATGLQVPWGLAFLPDGDLLVGERTTGRILQVPKDGGKPVVVKELPGVDKDIGEGGLLGLAVSPDYAKDKQVYAYYTGAEDNRVVHFSLDGDETPIVTGIYRSTNHDGGRLAFGPDGKLYITTGDGLEGSRSQDPANPGGKILRINPDGSIPDDNPVEGNPYWTLGHRNVQGLHYVAEARTMWAHEHGPRGGDEIIVITAGSNYGWPRTTFGIDYDGTQISQLQTAEGVTGPIVVWVPSIAPSGLTVYRGDAFPDWRGDLLLGGLASRDIRRVRIARGKAVLQEVLLDDSNTRIRDVRTGPDGYVYVLTDEAEGKLLRLEPA
jgi:glucose/arabinose dehydrogenase